MKFVNTQIYARWSKENVSSKDSVGQFPYVTVQQDSFLVRTEGHAGVSDNRNSDRSLTLSYLGGGGGRGAKYAPSPVFPLPS